MENKSLISQYLSNVIEKYASKMKLWEGVDLLALLSKEEEIRAREPSIEALYQWPWSGKAYVKMYKKARDMHMPFHFIPSCSRFKAILSPYDWIFAIFGRAVRGKGSTFEVRNWRNGPANKYLFGVFLQLGRHRDRGEGGRYWELGFRLMKSHAYQVSAFNYVHHNWHRNMSMKDVNRVMAGVKKLVEDRATEISFKRVYIPKASGKLRPLGVPSLEWRVYLHMLNNLIVWSRIGKEGSQHAYFPGRGVHTAWQEVFEKIESPYIYEFDLTGFFDNVDLSNIRKRLREDYGVPESVLSFLEKLNRSLVTLTEEDKIEEPDRGVNFLSTGEMNRQAFDMDAEAISNYLTVGEDYLETKPISSSALSVGVGMKRVGVPQGAATSCSISTVAISEVTEESRLREKVKESGGQGGSVVMYADDGIVFLDRESDLAPILKVFEESGVSVNESKSGWIKRNGLWEKDMKFLGITYSGVSKTIRASTREGATLEFSYKEQFLAFLLDQREKLLLGGSAGHMNSLESLRGVSVKSWVYSELKSFLSLDHPQSLLFRGRWSGYFLSSLYCDSWDKSMAVNNALTIGNAGCWVKSVWPRYRYKALKDLSGKLLEGKMQDLMRRVEWFPQVPYHGTISPEFRWEDVTDVMGSREEIEDKRISQMTRKELIRDVSELVSMLKENVKGLSKLFKELRTLVAAECIYGSSNRQFVTSVEGKKVYGAGFGEETRKDAAVMLGSSLDINVSNASTFACDSLLRDYPFELARHGYVTRFEGFEDFFNRVSIDALMEEDLEGYDRSGETVDYGTKVLGPEVKLSESRGPRWSFYYEKDRNPVTEVRKSASGEWVSKGWEEKLSRMTEKLKYKVSKEFKRNFRVGPLIFVRSVSTWSRAVGMSVLSRLSVVNKFTVEILSSRASRSSEGFVGLSEIDKMISKNKGIVSVECKATGRQADKAKWGALVSSALYEIVSPKSLEKAYESSKRWLANVLMIKMCEAWYLKVVAVYKAVLSSILYGYIWTKLRHIAWNFWLSLLSDLRNLRSLIEFSLFITLCVIIILGHDYDTDVSLISGVDLAVPGPNSRIIGISIFGFFCLLTFGSSILFVVEPEVVIIDPIIRPLILPALYDMGMTVDEAVVASHLLDPIIIESPLSPMHMHGFWE